MPDHIPGARAALADRTALVTGAGQGIGAAVAQALAAEGARVLATDRTAEGVKALAADWAADPARWGEGAGGTITAEVMDVTDAASVEAVVAEAERAHGPLDILVNVAGILRPGPAAELTDADWADTFAVNTSGVLHTARAVTPRMAARGRGSVVTVGSNAAGVPRTGMAAYAASKAAAAMYTKCLGLELARSGVRCNVVAPGSTDTAMQRALWADEAAPRRVIDGDPATYRTGIPLGRIAEPRDIADAVVFLASDRARHITMQELYVDGGATLR
ncbi:2,3-dihydro-2,3-dihydroxybenzoate dehydrogenase [Streptomyces spectabilis]|uniref:2,3-dihydro-2,3-dihydroxybenzoate dehydrogenase n=1 Tax=Streptomyces spectabilis TaxID=68270 RepID=A0A5P2X2M7_STRST|nr:2,3-dihydro-2,3-dihydroxybenzoate dehydrogenase [Streptomyces spectabilis]MBB5101176.1 2,3-dihydro-2,3-dihydroxybenzoate dehydrogenase [Streptomyces spectabilis]MCI3900380.1 2,3-dihydro-2,3-dihydroxybenzoate dehydrogenase [Streptomyces spectabilis]QEV57964.1 2,3-dihydro-2,3-dihydroxybenzoate dehydrogenase [Streptomyces spectabilis]GGV09841.1 2,3-dihydro-2,3-dihydroxybenzoate dehydrogenase [Streptomyces spectabilis]